MGLTEGRAKRRGQEWAVVECVGCRRVFEVRVWSDGRRVRGRAYCGEKCRRSVGNRRAYAVRRGASG